MPTPPQHPNEGAASAGPQVRCPSCGVTHVYSTDNPYRPFCSKGCKAIDLGAWASEHYRVEAKPTTEDLLDAPD
ncbi:DNA gyrase inhibitor YacG [Aquabacterium sp. UBA2148]|uniref:DNA gyrase inhibitor YacG n=1 Tax=Aquabacterium sp. UBA2148 TaxID=1946042 RepID=UPI0010F6E60E